MEDLSFEIEGGWIEDRQSRFEDSIMLRQHSIHIFRVILCHESCYFGDIVKL